VPPPTQIGDRILPARARPVPFCRQGFLPPPLTKPFDFVAALPVRRLASLHDHGLVQEMGTRLRAKNRFVQGRLNRRELPFLFTFLLRGAK
jgi:hypothetical protein